MGLHWHLGPSDHELVCSPFLINGPGLFDFMFVVTENQKLPDQLWGVYPQTLFCGLQPSHIVAHQAEVAILTVSAIRLLSHTVERNDHRIETTEHKAINIFVCQLDAEVGAEQDLDLLFFRVTDHLRRAFVKQRFAPIVHVELEQIVSNLINGRPEELFVNRDRWAKPESKPRRTGGALKIAEQIRLDECDDWIVVYSFALKRQVHAQLENIPVCFWLLHYECRSASIRLAGQVSHSSRGRMTPITGPV